MRSQCTYGHFHLLYGCDSANAHVRAIVVVSPEASRGDSLSRIYGFDDVLIQSFIPDCAVVTRDRGAPLRLPGVNVLNGDRVVFTSDQQPATDVVTAFVDPDHPKIAAQFHDALKASEARARRQLKVDLDAQILEGEVVPHVWQLERVAVTQPVGLHVHRPDQVRHRLHGQRLGLVPLQNKGRAG